MRMSATAQQPSAYARDTIASDWNIISAQLLNQWCQITPAELERTHHNRHRIALLVEEKYGVQAGMTENYLHNLEQVLPRFN